MLIDDFLPVYDVSDSVATLVHADLPSTWDALMNVDLIDVGRRRPLVAALGALRALPDIVSHVLHGEPPKGAPPHIRLNDLISIPMGEGGWILVGDRPQDEIALGLVGKFWRPVIEFADVSRDDFVVFDRPGFAKTIYSLAVRRIGENQTLLSGTMRTATTDEHARKWFRRYWSFGVGSGAHMLVNSLIDVVREDAERRADLTAHEQLPELGVPEYRHRQEKSP
jgi:hypothetical protein